MYPDSDLTRGLVTDQFGLALLRIVVLCLGYHIRRINVFIRNPLLMQKIEVTGDTGINLFFACEACVCVAFTSMTKVAISGWA